MALRNTISTTWLYTTSKMDHVAIVNTYSWRMFLLRMKLEEQWIKRGNSLPALQSIKCFKLHHYIAKLFDPIHVKGKNMR
jgi:hypothetical protein